MPRIEEILLTEFRGATGSTRVALDPTKPFVLLYGENGSGKSTLIDGLDVALTGGVGSLADVSTGGAVRARFLRSLGAAAPTKAAAKVAGEWWEATLSGSALSRTTPGSPLAVHVLRRRQIQRLIEATDSQKYDVIEPCLGIAGAAKAEDALARALLAQGKLLKAATDRMDQSRKALEALCAGAGGPIGNAPEWARRIVAIPRDELRAEGERLEETERRWQAADEAVAGLTEALGRRQSATEELRRHEAEAAPSVGLSGEEAASLVGLLEAARDHLAAHPSDRCPVCEEGTALVAALDRRLQALSAAQAHRKTAERLRAAVGERDAQAATLAGRVVEQGGKLARLLADPEAPLLPDLGEAAAVAEALSAMETKKRALHARRETVARRLADVSGLTTNLRLYDEAAGTVQALRTTVSCLRATSEIVGGSRKTYVQGALDELQKDVERMYALVHPDEEAAAGRMQLDEAKSGSLRHTVRLGRHEDVAPAPYFSESHQDTLAICILLAVAKRQGGRDSILLLDDVLMSVDNRHMDRLLDLLLGEIESFGHVVMTTHVLRFFQKVREHAAAEGAEGSVELLYLLPHGLDAGIRVSGLRPETAP